MKSPKLFAFAGLAVLTLISPIRLVPQADDLEERVDWLLNKGWELYDQKSYVVSEIMLQNALIRAEDLGDDHPKHAMVHYALGRILEAQEKFDPAETQYLESTSVWTQVKTPAVELIEPVEGLGRIYYKQGRFEEAEPHFQHVIDFWMEAPEGEFRSMKAGAIGNLASLYFAQERYEEAEPLFVKALELESGAIEPVLFEVAFRMHDLALTYHMVEKYADAETLFASAIQALDESDWKDATDLADFMEDYASLLSTLARDQEAKEWNSRAAKLRSTPKNKNATDK